jgi:phage terminase Nu1 subunit (DNA packaging protein)
MSAENTAAQEKIKRAELLNSWKQIADYLNRSVRTVQRWELYDLPVHRPSGRSKSSVYALVSEIDAWLTHHGRHRDDFSNG